MYYLGYPEGQFHVEMALLKYSMSSSSLQLCNSSSVRAVDLMPWLSRMPSFVVTTHTVVLQITVLLLLGGGGETDSKDSFVFLFDFTLS